MGSTAKASETRALLGRILGVLGIASLSGCAGRSTDEGAADETSTQSSSESAADSESSSGSMSSTDTETDTGDDGPYYDLPAGDGDGDGEPGDGDGEPPDCTGLDVDY